MKVILFGTGKKYEQYKRHFLHAQVVGIIDNNQDKVGRNLDGVFIDSPENISSYDYDYVFIMAKNYEQMRQQLLDLGVPENRIIDSQHKGIFEGVRSYETYAVKREQDKPLAIMLTHNCEYTGAPLVLLNAAKVIKKTGYNVKVISMEDGPLKYDLLMQGIEVTIWNNEVLDVSVFAHEIQRCSMIFVNTLLFHRYIPEIASFNKPVIWWLHEEDDWYKNLGIVEHQAKEYSNVKVYGVGHRVMKSYSKFLGLDNIKPLLYGIAEFDNTATGRTTSDMIFAFIGTVIPRKGDDILVEAIKMLNESGITGVQYWFVGMIDDCKKSIYEKIPNVRICGCVEHDRMLRMYSDIDVVVCPSRNDPMPVVVTEGMMQKKVCIVSENCGQATYIEPYKDGLVCEAESVKSLYDSMKWCIDNRTELDDIGRQAYSLYKNNFSSESFERNIKELLKDL